MPKDNFETSPSLVVARQKGNVARLNMEIAILPSDNATEQQGGGGASASTNLATAAIILGGGGSAGGGRCFTGETIISLFHELHGVAISRIEVGRAVLAFNEFREIVEAEVLAVMVHETTELWRVELETGVALNVTPEHLMFDGNGFKPVREFAPGDWFFTEEFTVVEISAISRMVCDPPVLVYNIETTAGTYFANEVAVHNAKAPPED
jgi:hypothetical protein